MPGGRCRVQRHRRDLGMRFTRRRLLELGGGAGRPGADGRRSRPALGAAPAATNVVVIVLDNVRADFTTSSRTAPHAGLDRSPPRACASALSPRGVSDHSGAPLDHDRAAGSTPSAAGGPSAGLPREPGWEAIARSVPVFTDVLGRAGYRTGYVTDNPHILSAPTTAFMRRFDGPVTVKGQVPFRGKPAGAPVSARGPPPRPSLAAQHLRPGADRASTWRPTPAARTRATSSRRGSSSPPRASSSRRRRGATVRAGSRLLRSARALGPAGAVPEITAAAASAA